MIESRWQAETLSVLVSIDVAGLRFRCHWPQRNSRDGIVVTEALGPPDAPARSASAITPASTGPAPASDPAPHRARWIVVAAVAVISFIAAVCIPAITRAMVDGHMRHHHPGGLWVLGIAATTLGLAALVTVTVSVVWPIASMDFLLSRGADAEIPDVPRDVPGGPQPEPVRTGRLELDDVGFRVPDAVTGEQWLLRHVTLIVEAGETLALVGAAGAGTSLLTALLSRLYDASEGRILLDGQDIREMSLPTLRGAVCTAFEDPTVFSMSVAEHLRIGRPDATDAELSAALDIAAARFVHDLPFGIDTRIGEQGMRLSGGQRQRLCLARAIVATPKLLVIDDALPGLDTQTEIGIAAALRVALKGVTGIIVARRISSVLLADRVPS